MRGLMLAEKTMTQTRRPPPPVGFVPWKQRYRNVGGATVLICPRCDDANGFKWHDGGLYRSGEPGEYERWCVMKDRPDRFEKWKFHWSRFGLGRCLRCELLVFHDFVDGPMAKHCGAGWQFYHEEIKETRRGQRRAARA